MSTFANRLKSTRQAAGLSQEQLGVLAGIEEASASARLNRYERGTRVPALDIVGHIAEALDVPVAYLYSKSDDEANLLLAFHKMSASQKSELLKFIATMP